ncbi:MAG: class I SAM-dependent methyltransferase [Bryobacteraceae bacterium]|nr:class I SAM-dependent methyltransferase [Bryobacteraceae bacterium]
MNAAPCRQLALYYDAIFSPRRAPVDAARNHILARILPAVQTACDLACGTGVTAVQLASRGIQTAAVDFSPDMCRLTRARAKAAGARLKVIHADMREFRLPAPVDLITCESDALNHIPRRSDLRRVIRSVSRALNPGGHFYFEVNNEAGFRRYWITTSCTELPGVLLVMRNSHSPDGRTAWSDLDWFIASKNERTWRRVHERVQEVCWTAEQITETLTAAGFDAIRTHDSTPYYRDNPWIVPGCRTVWLARKSVILTAEAISAP